MIFLLHLGNNVETNVKWRVTNTKFLSNQSDFYNMSNSSIPTQVHTCVGMDHLTSNIHTHSGGIVGNSGFRILAGQEELGIDLLTFQLVGDLLYYQKYQVITA